MHNACQAMPMETVRLWDNQGRPSPDVYVIQGVSQLPETSRKRIGLPPKGWQSIQPISRQG
ncbi:MAG: hypothetical protein CL681_29515 [Blastopirellula sp.]|nr:hypothetical protein [Blastopirellula sp.]|tara:strand:- start:191 stop:373 length:183 start_codon:yes stop_codon:yes gene_type:complete